MTTLQLASKAIQAWDKRLSRVMVDRASRIRVVQHECNHKQVVECNHLGSGFPPIRLCLYCGMTEDGWGSGYLILKASHVGIITRNEVYELRRGLMLRNHHKGPLLRCEVTIHDLIDGKEVPSEVE